MIDSMKCYTYKHMALMSPQSYIYYEYNKIFKFYLIVKIIKLQNIFNIYQHNNNTE